jgi:hypothetical protein
MAERAIKKRLERALNVRLSGAEWQHLKESELVGEYQRDVLSWQEFRDHAAQVLRALRRFYQNQQREDSGKFSAEEMEVEENEVAPDPLDYSSSLSKRTFARSQALGALNRLQTGGRSAGMPAIYGTLVPRGGVDDTVPQWVHVLAVELWVPHEEVANTHLRMQRSMSDEASPPKTSEQTFEVAAFVWDNMLADEPQAPWPELWERWNSWPLTKRFAHWRSFHKAFSRGAEATRPRYKASDEQIAEQVRSGGQGVLDTWVQKVRG